VATSQISKVIDHLRKAVLPGGEADLSDGQLLECFVRHRDEVAVAALVRRHGPMIWNVCRRVLRSHQDAEDAFQATFLVLVRKAASITSREMVANWLHAVAHQTARKARATAGKRQAREKQVNDMPEPSVREPDLWHDLKPLLDDELSHLPEKYRVPIILCDLEGKTRKEAAAQLGCPEGSLSSRLSRARVMLAKRLARHGLAVSGASLATVLSQQAASACLPGAVMNTTIKTATLYAVGQAVTGVISAKVAVLTEGVLKTMLLTKLKTVTALLMMLSLVTLTTAMLAWGQTGDEANGVEPTAKAEKREAQAQQKDPPKHFTNFVPDQKPDPDQPKDPPKNFANSIGMKFVWIPAGNFLMGSPKDEEGRNDDEIPHKVTLTKGFFMGVHLVTQEQWQAVMGNNPSNINGEKNLPVELVSWDECQAFIKKLRKKDKKSYRLPSEAEWECACRAGTTTPFSLGETISTDHANYNGNDTYGTGKKGKYREKTTPVGTFPANAWGLHDMHGNVWQWCQDWHGDYPQSDVVDPTGPEIGQFRVRRGGSWLSNPRNCRSAYRGSDPPGDSGGNIGFRLCFSLAQGDDTPKSPAIDNPQAQPKAVEGEKEKTLTVTIKSQKNSIRVNQPFKVDLRVVNSSKAPQSFLVWSCGWYAHWESSNYRVSPEGWDCKKNYLDTVKLEPGEAYEQTLPILFLAGKPQAKVSFKMGFTPGRSKQTYWSNEITLQVEPEAKANDRPLLNEKYSGDVLPNSLQKAYADFVTTAKQPTPKNLMAHCVPFAVEITTEKRKGQTLGSIMDMNVPFLKSGFVANIHSVRKENEDCYMIRTGSTAIWFVETKTMGWKIYRYLDKSLL
jgi:RNA polymerase sigma factor (sigma-70 family)